MTTDRIPMNGRQTGVIVALLTASSVALTLGFACALPVAAFAVMASMLFDPIAAVGAIGAVSLANQIVGFAFLHYPTDASTLAWGVALGVIGLLSVGAALAVLSRLHGAAGIFVGFLVAFAVYEEAVYLACLLSGTGVGSFTAPVMIRILSDQRRCPRLFCRRSRAVAALTHRERDWSGSRPAACLNWIREAPVTAAASSTRRPARRSIEGAEAWDAENFGGNHVPAMAARIASSSSVRAAGPGCKIRGDLISTILSFRTAGITSHPLRYRILSGCTFLPHHEARIRSGAAATTASGATIRSEADCRVRSAAKTSSPPAISTSSDTQPIPLIRGSFHSSK